MAERLFENAKIGDVFISEKGTEYSYRGYLYGCTNYTHLLQPFLSSVLFLCNDNGIDDTGSVRIVRKKFNNRLLTVPNENCGNILRRACEMYERKQFSTLGECVEQAEKEWLIKENYYRGYRIWESPIKRLFRKLNNLFNNENN